MANVKKSGVDDWDSTDDEGEPATATVNPYCKKRMTIELAALMAKEQRLMTAVEINAMFKDEFGYDFPVANFHPGELEDYLITLRELITVREIPRAPRFKANLEYKYKLLHKQAVGGKSRNPDDTRSAASVAKAPRQKLTPVVKGAEPANKKPGNEVAQGLGQPNGGQTSQGSACDGRARTVTGGQSGFNNTNKRASTVSGWNNDFNKYHPRGSGHQNWKKNGPKEFHHTGPRQQDAISHSFDHPTTDHPLNTDLGKENVGAVENKKKLTLDELLDGKKDAEPGVEEKLEEMAAEVALSPVPNAKTVALLNGEKDAEPGVEEKVEEMAVKVAPSPVPSAKTAVLSIDDLMDFLARVFRHVGDKCKRKFFIDDVMEVIEAHPDTFRCEVDRRVQWIVLEKSIVAKATTADLMWLTRGKCVASSEQPYDRCKIIDILPTGVLVCSTLLGVAQGVRLEQISKKLKARFDENKLQKATTIVTGKMYIMNWENHLVRAILIEMGGYARFKALLVDRPQIVAAETMWEVPADFALTSVPGNIFLAKLRGHREISKKMKEEMAEVFFNPTNMVFFGDDGNGIRVGDWLKCGKWFSEHFGDYKNYSGPSVQEAEMAFEIRDLCDYFDFRLDYTQVLPPFSSREAAPPELFQQLFEVTQKNYLAKPVEERRGFLQQAVFDLKEIAASVRPANQKEAEAALRLYRMPNAATGH